MSEFVLVKRELLERLVNPERLTHNSDLQELRAVLAQEAGWRECATCGGKKIVDDGELTCSAGGIPYANGPIRLVKDCPDCAEPPAPVAAICPICSQLSAVQSFTDY